MEPELTSEELDERQRHLSELGETLEDARAWIQGVLADIGWTQDHLLQKDEDLVVCPTDKGHRMPAKSLERHSRLCPLLKDGYKKEDLVVEPNHFYDKATLVQNVSLDDETFFRIVGQPATGMPVLRHQPQTTDRMTTDLSIEQRVAVYEHCVQQAKAAGKPVTMDEDQLMLLEKKEEKKAGMTLLERRALERDMKRRRQAYRGKSTHTGKKSHLEVLRELIDTQTGLLREMWQGDREASKGTLPTTPAAAASSSSSPKPEEWDRRSTGRRDDGNLQGGSRVSSQGLSRPGRPGSPGTDRASPGRPMAHMDDRLNQRISESLRESYKAAGSSKRRQNEDSEEEGTVSKVDRSDDTEERSERKRHKHKKHRKHKKDHKKGRDKSTDRSPPCSPSV